MYRILVVCTGNTCRSPMAEALFKLKAENSGQSENFKILSAGIAAQEQQPASSGAIKAMSKYGAVIDEHSSRQLKREYVESADLVLTMTLAHKNMLLMNMPGIKAKVFTLAEYAGETGDIADPYGGSDYEYEIVAKQIANFVDKIWKKVLREAGMSQILENSIKEEVKKSVRVAIGSDHGGFKLKQEVVKILQQDNILHEDLGTYSAEAVDYPDIAWKVASAVSTGKFDRGIIICGTGIGVAIAANKVKGIRAALCGDVYSAAMSRAHNYANVLTLGERVTGIGLAGMIVKTWLSTDFEGGRHSGRIKKISQMEA